MKQIVLFDPSYGTFNLGDIIINEAIMCELRPVFENAFLARFSTHNPILHEYQLFPPTTLSRFCNYADLKFLGGTNLIKTSLIGRKPDWNINPCTVSLYRGSVGVGVGLGGKGTIANSYTRWMYRRAFSASHIHSVRDRRTEIEFKALGLRAINTGCPTMWALTPQHCSQIPTQKAKRVVFTATDYSPNPEQDFATIKLLHRLYDEVHVWIQGSRDYEYLTRLDALKDMRIIPPSVDAFRQFLGTQDVDYVGTRLHAGIFAMRNFRRTIIVGVDHRASDIQESHNINVVPRGDIRELERLICSEFESNVNVDSQLIKEWKSQFHEMDG